MAKKRWVYSPKKQATKAPDSLKQTVKAKADEIVQTVLIPQYVKPPPEEPRLNYLVNIYTKWYRHYFYFCSTYHSPGPHAISPSFDDKFARLEYVASDSFNLAYMRYTGKWQDGSLRHLVG
ncbi:MAG: hypothetical protein SVT56_11570 [Chloroflexota bacterium]|nr:hypothetical protein [Chloroflexota bacterium]